MLSLRASALKWRGNPPVRGELHRIVPERMEVAAIFGGNRYLAPFNRGIATTTAPAGASRAQPPKAALSAEECAHWLAMTAKNVQTPIDYSQPDVSLRANLAL